MAALRRESGRGLFDTPVFADCLPVRHEISETVVKSQGNDETRNPQSTGGGFLLKHHHLSSYFDQYAVRWSPTVPMGHLLITTYTANANAHIIPIAIILMINSP